MKIAEVPRWQGVAVALALASVASCASEKDAASVVGSGGPPRGADNEAVPPRPEPPEAPDVAGTHLDGVHSGYEPRDYRPAKRSDKTIELILRSTPPGAVASIDGKAIGTTPTFWSGRADHQAHEFTFVKPGYAMARYRFVPTQNGVVHGSLTRLQSGGSLDAGPVPPAAPSH